MLAESDKAETMIAEVMRDGHGGSPCDSGFD
jgi:hypothetical protein